MKKPFNTTCTFCAIGFYRPPNVKRSVLKRNPLAKFYCNKSCKARTEFPKKRIIVHCDTCGKEISRSLSGIEKHNFCDRKCCNLWKRQFTGEQTPNWKGGYNKDERTRIRSRIAWKELRINILNKFDFQCGVCGEVDSFHIHHLIPWRLGGKDIEDNLIPLCPKCHSAQTVKDWETEHHMTWEKGGAHTYRGVI